MADAENPAARLLDLTRTLRRADRTATGIDRVELAYLAHLMTGSVPLFGLVRTPLGYLLLDGPGLKKLHDRLEGRAQWGRATMLSRLSRGRGRVVRQAESDLRKFAVARARPDQLTAMLRRHLSGHWAYYNVGHSNLTDRVFRAVQHAGGRINVLIHDVIPLTHPQFQRPGTVDPFRAKLQRVSRAADRVIYNSRDTQANAERFMAEWGRVPPGIVAHLGTDTPRPDATALPDNLPPDRPYFVIVGTIEPRKNHAFLLDVWERLGSDAPPLLICGRRGWNNDPVFARLDSLPQASPVRELSDLSDPALAALVRDAAGLLFPSHVEGFGLPPVEALSLGTRVLCNDLPVLREVMGENAVYASVSDPDLWQTTIKDWAQHPSEAQKTDTFSAPNWADHFKIVLRLSW